MFQKCIDMIHVAYPFSRARAHCMVTGGLFPAFLAIPGGKEFIHWKVDGRKLETQEKQSLCSILCQMLLLFLLVVGQLCVKIWLLGYDG